MSKNEGFRFAHPQDAQHLIGRWVKKVSRKPFASGYREDLVADVALHPVTGRPALVLASCGTQVEAGKCEPA